MGLRFFRSPLKIYGMGSASRGSGEKQEKALGPGWGLYYEQLPLFAMFFRLLGRLGYQMTIGKKGDLNREAIGKEYEGKVVSVTPEKIKLFAHATNDFNPLYQASNPQEMIAPPMFVSHFSCYSIMKLFADKDLCIDFSGMFHAGQDVEFFRSLRPGEQAYARSRVQKIVEMDKGNLLLTQTFGFTDKNELIFKASSKWFVKKHRPRSQSKKSSHPTFKTPEFRELLFWESEDPEKVISFSKIHIRKNQMNEYAKISGDYNLIHISKIGAKLFGMKEKILQGMGTMAMVASHIINEYLAGNPRRLKRLNVRFVNNVKGGDELETLYWPIDPKKTPWTASWIEAGEKNLSILGFKTRNQNGDIVISRGVAKVENA